MTDEYWVGFEKVELVSGLSADKPVWLFLRGTLYDESNPDQPLWMHEVGSLPPDANRPAPEGFPVGDAGYYADHLPIGQAVSRMTSVGTPTYELAGVAVGPGQVLEVLVIMLPKVWLETKKVKPSDLDTASLSIFTGLIGASGFGVIGGIVTGVVTALFGGGSEQEVDAPCFNSIIMARHRFTSDDLDRIRNAGSERFGPFDNEASAVCAPIDSYYWLTVNRPTWSFGTTPPVKKGGCTLELAAYTPPGDYVGGKWGDVGNWYDDGVIATVNMRDRRLADVWITEHRSGSDLILTFPGVHLELGTPDSTFFNNVFENPKYPARSPKPACARCSHFTNLKWAKAFPKALVVAAMQPGSHVGTFPVFPLKIDTDVPTTFRKGMCGCDQDRENGPRDQREERLRTMARKRDRAVPIRLNASTYTQELDAQTLWVWPTGTPPPIQTVQLPLKWEFDADLDMPLYVSRGIACWLLPCSSQITLASYHEFHGDDPCVPRLRYTRRNAEGAIVTDAMLEHMLPFIH